MAGTVGTRALGRAMAVVEARAFGRAMAAVQASAFVWESGVEPVIRHPAAAAREDFFSGPLDDPAATEGAWCGNSSHTGARGIASDVRPRLGTRKTRLHQGQAT